MAQYLYWTIIMRYSFFEARLTIFEYRLFLSTVLFRSCFIVWPDRVKRIGLIMFSARDSCANLVVSSIGFVFSWFSFFRFWKMNYIITVWCNTQKILNEWHGKSVTWRESAQEYVMHFKNMDRVEKNGSFTF